MGFFDMPRTESAEDMLEKFRVRELVEYERFCRDNALWDSMLACFAQLYMMCSNLIIFTSGLIFPYYLMPKWLSIASRIFSPIANIAVELKAVNLKGIGWDAAWPQLAGTALYTVFWLAAGGAIYAWSIKKERRLAGAAE